MKSLNKEEIKELLEIMFPNTTFEIKDIVKAYKKMDSKWITFFNQYHKCYNYLGNEVGRCFYTLVEITTRHGNKYWKCSKCGATYRPDGKREYQKTKFNQWDFT